MPKNEFICDCKAVNEKTVNEVADLMPCSTRLNRLAYFFKVLGDETRCKILFALLHHEFCVCDLASLLSMTKSSISHQLAKMKKNGIVKHRKMGKHVYYSLDDTHVKTVFETSFNHVEHKE